MHTQNSISANDHLVMLLDEAIKEIERLEFTILDHCCTCGSGINAKHEHSQQCVAIRIIDSVKPVIT